MLETIVLPTGPDANWEEQTAEGKSAGLKTTAESCVVLQSLKQSRAQWLSSTFPKFSTKSRGSKPPEVVPPPHSITFHGRCDLEIGPHTFRDTAIFEVRYLSQFPVAVQQYMPASSPSTVNGSSSTQRASTPLISALASEVSVTPALVAQVNRAASTNPTLAHLVYLAAGGRATSEQLKTLGLLIQSMAISPTASDTQTPAPSQQLSGVQNQDHDPPPLSLTQQGPYPPLSQDFDLVLEFRETSPDKSIFPHVPAVCKQLESREKLFVGSCDVSITACVPFPGVGSKGPPQLCNFYLRNATPVIWNLLARWGGDDERIRNNQGILNQTVVSERVYLAHRLPESDLLKEIRNAAVSEPPMKPIKPSHSDNSRQRRRTASRKAQSSPGMHDASRGITKKRMSETRLPTIVPNTRPLMSCSSCGQTDVPLFMAGQFCRQCIDAGRASTDIPINQGKAWPTQTSDVPTVRSSTPQRKSKSHQRVAMIPTYTSSPLAVNPPLVPEESGPGQ